MYVPEDNSHDDEVPSTSTVQQPPPFKKKKATKILQKWKKADLTAQAITGRVTESPNDFFTETRIPTEKFELFLMTTSLNSLSDSLTYTLQRRV